MNVRRQGWMRLAVGSQTETDHQKSSATREELLSEDADYEEVSLLFAILSLEQQLNSILHKCLQLLFLHTHCESYT